MSYSSYASVLLSSNSSHPRPAPVKQKTLPPFDPDDSGGAVHRTQPPDLIVPSSYEKDFWRGDIDGVMLPEIPPFVPGASTTPPNMVMSFLLPKYVQFGSKWVDMILTAHAERNYSHFHLDRAQADEAGLSDKQFVDLIEYVQSWGFYASAWLSGSGDDRSRGWASIGPRITSFLDELLSRKSKTLDNFIALPGEELNNGCPPGPGGADDIINAVCTRLNPHDIPVWLHFTANYPGWPPPPSDGNIDRALVEWWQQWVGKVKGMCWQGDQNQPAGLMGAKMWDARRILSRASYDFKLVAFELLATNELYGRVDEEYGCLRGLEMLWCTSDGSAPPVSGFGNGARLPDGLSI